MGSRYGFCGSSYKAKSTIADGQRLYNLRPEPIESGLGRSGTPLILVGTPGLKTKWDLDFIGASRALFAIPRSYPTKDRVFAVNGPKLYELFSDFTATVRGDVGSDGFPAYIASNGRQLGIASAQRLYVLTLETNAFAGPILDTEGDFVTPINVVELSQYAVINVPGTQKMQFSLQDMLVWDPADFFEAEAEPDRVTRIIVSHKELWAFGDSTVQPFVVGSDPDAPFEPIESGVIEQGLAAPDSVARIDNSLIWLGGDSERGGRTMWKSQGYLAVSVSNIPLDIVLSGYDNDALAQARAFSYMYEGHPTYQLSFPDPKINETWRYDAKLPLPMAWYQVGCWNRNEAKFDAHRSVTHCYGFGMHIVGGR